MALLPDATEQPGGRGGDDLVGVGAEGSEPGGEETAEAVLSVRPVLLRQRHVVIRVRV